MLLVLEDRGPRVLPAYVGSPPYDDFLDRPPSILPSKQMISSRTEMDCDPFQRESSPSACLV